MTPSQPKRLTPLTWAATTAVLALFITILTPIPVIKADTNLAFLDDLNLARRATYTMPDLAMDIGLYDKAKWYVDQQTANCTFSDSVDKSKYGSAQALLYKENPTPDDVVNMFYSGKQYYNYTTNSCEQGKEGLCQAFTQMVWKLSDIVGCYMAPCIDNALNTIAICLFHPRGNIHGKKPY